MTLFMVYVVLVLPNCYQVKSNEINKMMKHLEKELYEAPQISKLVLNNDLSLLITFSVEGNVDDIEDGGEW